MVGNTIDRWTAAPVQERPDVSLAEFRSDHVEGNTPVLRPGAVSDWGAVGTWTPEWLGSVYGGRSLPSSTRVIADVVEAIDDRDADASLYARNLRLGLLDPALAADVSPLPAHVTSNNWLLSRLLPGARRRFEGELFIAPENMQFPYLHFDSCHVHANFFMIHGTKEVALFHPDQGPFLYPSTGSSKVQHVSAVNDVYEPDLDAFPEFAQARGTVVTLHPGDHLFVPSGWWHAVRSPEPSVSFVVKAAGRENWAHVVEDFPKRFEDRWFLRVVSRSHLQLVGMVKSGRR